MLRAQLSAVQRPPLGYRAWLIPDKRDSYQLRGVLSDALWASTEVTWTVAACTTHAWSPSAVVGHQQTSVPEPNCTCGLCVSHSPSIGGYDGHLVQPEDAEIGIVWARPPVPA
jgi:hypothetical protein